VEQSHFDFLLQGVALFIICSLTMLLVSWRWPHHHTTVSSALVWRTPWDALSSPGWPGLANYKVVAGILVVLLLVDVLFAPPGWQIRLEDYQRQRLLVYFGRDFAPASATPDQRRRAHHLQEERTYQVKQALISVGSGGVKGKGWRRGQQIALGFLPPGTSHNDFIFSVIAEEKGFLGSVTVLALYTAVLFTGIIADRILGETKVHCDTDNWQAEARPADFVHFLRACARVTVRLVPVIIIGVLLSMIIANI